MGSASYTHRRLAGCSRDCANAHWASDGALAEIFGPASLHCWRPPTAVRQKETIGEVRPQLNRSMAALANDFQQVAGVLAADEVAMAP